MIEENLLMKVENGVSRKDLSNSRRSFFPSLIIKPCGVRYNSGNIFSSQRGNDVVFFLHLSLLRVVSDLVIFLEMET